MKFEKWNNYLTPKCKTWKGNIWYTQHVYENTHVNLPFEWGS
jgi:hypothetical protein